MNVPVRIINCDLTDITKGLERSESVPRNNVSNDVSQSDSDSAVIEIPEDLDQYRDILRTNLNDTQLIRNKVSDTRRLALKANILKLGIISDTQSLEILKAESKALNNELARVRSLRVEKVGELQDELIRQSTVSLHWRNQLLVALRKLYMLQNKEDAETGPNSDEEEPVAERILVTFDNVAMLAESGSYFPESLHFVASATSQLGADITSRVSVDTLATLFTWALGDSERHQHECCIVGKALSEIIQRYNGDIDSSSSSSGTLELNLGTVPERLGGMPDAFDSSFVDKIIEGARRCIREDDSIQLTVMYEVMTSLALDPQALARMIEDGAVEMSLGVFCQGGKGLRSCSPSQSAANLPTAFPQRVSDSEQTAGPVSTSNELMGSQRTTSQREGHTLTPRSFIAGSDQSSVLLSSLVVKFLEFSSNYVSLSEVVVREGVADTLVIINTPVIGLLKGLTNDVYGVLDNKEEFCMKILRKAVGAAEALNRARKPNNETDQVLNYVIYLVAQLCGFPKTHSPLSASQSVAVLRSGGTVAKGRYLKVMARADGTPTFPIDTHNLVETLGDEYNQFFDTLLRRFSTTCQEASRRSSTDPDRCYRIINSTQELSASLLCIISFIQGRERSQDVNVTKVVMEAIVRLITVVYYGCVAEMNKTDKDTSTCRTMLCDVLLLCSIVKSPKSISNPTLLGYVCDVVDCVIPMMNTPSAPDDKAIALAEVLLSCADKIVKYACCVNDSIATSYAFLCDASAVKLNTITPTIKRLIGTMLLRLCVDKKKKRLVSEALSLFAKDEYGEGLSSELHQGIKREAQTL